MYSTPVAPHLSLRTIQKLSDDISLSTFCAKTENNVKQNPKARLLDAWKLISFFHADTGNKMINDFWLHKNKLKTIKSRLNWSFHYLKKPDLWLI